MIVERLTTAKWPSSLANDAARVIVGVADPSFLDKDFIKVIELVGSMVKPNRFSFWFDANTELLSNLSPREMFGKGDWVRMLLYFAESDE